MFLYDIDKFKTGEALSVRRKSDPENVPTGILMHIMEGGIVLKQYSNFIEDGYIVIKNEDIDELVHGDYEQKFQLIIRAENRVSDCGCSFLKELPNWKALFKVIYDKALICSYEIDDTIYLGRMIGLTEEHINMICFDCDFKAEKKPYRCNIDDILSVQLESDYIYIYQKYTT